MKNDKMYTIVQTKNVHSAKNKFFSVNLPCDAPDLILQSAMPEQKNDLFKDIGNNYF